MTRAIRTPARHGSTGIALVTAMMIMALCAATAVAISARQQIEIRRVTNIAAAARADEILRRLESDAMNLLQADAKRSRHDDLSENWSVQPVKRSDDTGSATGSLEDLLGRFNLANLSPSYRGAQSVLPGRSRAAGGSETETDPDGPDGNGGSAGGAAEIPDVAARGGADEDESAYLPDLPKDLSDEQVYGPDGVDDTSVVPEPAPVLAPGPGGAADEHGNAVARGPDEQTPEDRGKPGDEPQTTPPSTRAQLAEMRFRLLLSSLDIDPGLVQAVLDWIDEDSDTRFPNGAEDDYYLALDRPYRAANRPPASVRELLLIRGVTRETFNRLEPFVVVLPQPTALNVNSAPEQVLMSIAPGIDQTVASLLVRAREAQPFLDVRSVLAHPLLAGRRVRSEDIAVASDWFALDAATRVDSIRFATWTVFHRHDGRVRVLGRRRGYPGG